jgi:hypothetical protein
VEASPHALLIDDVTFAVGDASSQADVEAGGGGR